MSSLIMTVLGPDRPGLVESIASLVADHGGNWVESRMAHLAGQFAGIVHVDVPDENGKKLRQALEQLDLSITIVEDEGTSTVSTRSVSLELIGPDRPGIVRELSHALAENQINVEELETECASAPWSGEALFKASARLSVPEAVSMDRLREALEVIANDLTVDIDLIERGKV